MLLYRGKWRGKVVGNTKGFVETLGYAIWIIDQNSSKVELIDDSMTHCSFFSQ